MSVEENSDRGGHYSLDEIRSILLEMQAPNNIAPSATVAMNRELKLDIDGEDLIFVGEPALSHRCDAMRCGSSEHVVFRVSFANLLITRKAKRLVSNFLKDL